MGAVNTTYTFTATDTITSTKMNNIIDETVMTSDAVLGGSGGSGGLDIASGKLSISNGAINSSRLASSSVTTNAITNGNVTPEKLSAGGPIWNSSGVLTSSGTISSPGLFVGGSSSSYSVLDINNTGGAQVQLNANGNSEGNLRTSTNHPLTLSTNNTERMRITASGNVGIGTSSPSAPLHVQGQSVTNADAELTITGSSGYINFHNSLTPASFNGIVSSGDKSIIFSDGTSGTGAFVIAPWAANASGIRINSSGNVGICKTSPSTALDVNGTVTATAFSGPLTGNVTGDVTGNVTGNVTGSSGSCTGNSATSTLATKASTLSNGGGNGSAMTFNWNGQSGQPDWVWGSINASSGANHYVWNPANFSVNYANSAGSATTASTVSNSAITAAKLDGNQSGSAPIFGVRAWVNFDGTTANNIGGTYVRAGTTVTVTTSVAHGLIVGHKVFLDFTSGSAVDGAFVVTGITSSTIFTVTHGTSGATSGTVSLNRRLIRASGNVANVSLLGTGQYAVNFTTALPDANYARSGFANFSSTAVAGLVGGNENTTTTAQSCDIFVANSTSGSENNYTVVNAMFVG